jgi:hypothetical protein
MWLLDVILEVAVLVDCVLVIMDVILELVLWEIDISLDIIM